MNKKKICFNTQDDTLKHRPMCRPDLEGVAPPKIKSDSTAPKDRCPGGGGSTEKETR